jgi:DNA repair protein RecN (Recombination protein N)
MLGTLRIQDFVLIDEIELRLEPGYNVVTGETGAGKSIIVGALHLVLGGRARADLVRPGAREATVEALFDIQTDAALCARLEEAGIQSDGELLVRRVVHKSGRSRAYLNGRMCTLGELRELALALADVTSQHESVALSDARRHIDYLDRYAGLTDERDALAKVVDALGDTLASLRAARERAQSRGEREDFLRFQLEAIDVVDPQLGELEDLEIQRQRLAHVERLKTLTTGVLHGLEGGASWSADDHDARDHGQDPIGDRLARLSADLGSAAELDASLGSIAEELEDCWSRLRDAAGELSDYTARLEADPDALGAVQERLYALQELMRKHGPTLSEVLAAREQLATQLAELEGGEEQQQALEEKRSTLSAEAADRARRLSRKRRRAARNLGKAISAQLQSLGMGGARVLVDVSPTAIHGGKAQAGGAQTAKQATDPCLVVDGRRLSRRGIDRVELLIAPNKGLEPRPLARIASGGELSRALLAVKRVLGGCEGTAAGENNARSVGIQVFDEVDAGVGGATADKIGRCIADIASHRQVLCITHLAGIAACADAHFVVSKHDSTETTTSHIEQLDPSGRVTELARMLTGEKHSRASRGAAEEMLAAASRPSDGIRPSHVVAAE